ncbi:MAG: VWA domain-containing protein [Actinomycetota bacterium]
MTTADPATRSADQDEGGERLAVGFCRVLRRAGLRVPASATINFTEALGLVGLEDRPSVYWSGRATLVHRPEDLNLYDRVFAAYWEGRVGEGILVEGTPPPVTLALDIADEDDEDEQEQEPAGDIQPVRFSSTEVLTNKDFADCTREELAELTRLMARLRFTTHRRQSRRYVPVKGVDQRPDLRRTVRWALRHQGEPVKRAYAAPATRPRRLVLVVDVSGSMESYARALIRFAHAAVVARSKVEVFVLGTRLTRLTKHLTSRDPDSAIRSAMPQVKDWAGGTRLGDGIREFNDEWGIRGMARGSIVVILSDGWDRGDPATLGGEMERLHRVTNQLVWVNPLKATPGYAPLAAGMAAALPHVDRFVEGHSYRSLEHLAMILSGDERPA